MTSTKVRSVLPVHTFTTEFRSARQIHLEMADETSNVIFRSIALVSCSLMEAVSTYLAPSYCSHHAVWGERQEDGAANLCLRPTDKHLTNTVLHDVFRQFQLQARNSISGEIYGVQATHAAFFPGERMGSAFSEEEGLGRIVAFDNCVPSLFSAYVPHETQNSMGFYDEESHIVELWEEPYLVLPDQLGH